jgi:large subunit ribosomal protein L25
VLVKELQRDPVSRQLLHADLYEVDVTAKLHLRVALHFVGRAAGAELGGILQPIRRDIEVLCLPTEIPDFIEVDVTQLGIHDAIHMSDLKPPPGVEIPFDTDDALVTVLPPVVEEVKVAEPAEGEAAAAAAPAEGAAAKPGEAAPKAGSKPEGGKGAS